MAIFKCKMCGGDLEIKDTDKVIECEYCGTNQTVPSADNEKKLNLFNRANRLRINGEFDKATAIYENIVAEFPEEAEAYWGLVICNYGIEYVDDPATARKIPTCHRASFESIQNDENFNMALEYADVVAQKIYRDEAREIDRIREEILAVSRNEQPYDIFICYKESAEDGERTIDSVIAQDLYDTLTDKGYKVFFARISLEDKLGSKYEPYIFAALNSAKIMLSIGTKYEYFHAVWVKNEWSRFLKLMAKDKSKVLIPCYKDMDAYDMPDEFKALQAQDLGKVGSIQDLIRGIEKILLKESKSNETGVIQQSANNPTVDSLLERAFMFLEDGKWEEANDYCEKALDIYPKCAKAYLGKLMAELKVKTQNQLSNQKRSFEDNANFKKALLFADESLSDSLKDYVAAIAELAKETQNELTIIREKLKPAQNLICAGDSHSVVLKKDGTLIIRGNNEFGQRKALNWTDIVAVAAGNDYTVGLKNDGTVVAKGNNEYGQCNVEEWTDIVAIAAGRNHTVGLKRDGAVVATGNNSSGQCDVEEWFDIVAVSARNNHTVGLKKDGTVVATGFNSNGECNVKDWNDIVAIAVGCSHTVGLKKDGTLIATPHIYNQIMQSWTDIVAVSAGDSCTVGLKKDGTLIIHGNNEFGQRKALNWTDIVAVAAGNDYTVGLKKDGTVVAVGKNIYGQCNVQDWKLFDDFDNLEQESLIARQQKLDEYNRHCDELKVIRKKIKPVQNLLSLNIYHIAGVKYDGTVVATGLNDYGQCDVQNWTDILSVSTGFKHTAGLKKDGTVVATGSNDCGQCNVQNWTDIINVYAGAGTTFGLKKDGTVVATGSNDCGECNVENWKDIIDISVGSYHTIGLKKDGTVVATGGNDKYRCDVQNWTDIVNISVRYAHTVGLKKDGTVVATGLNDYGQCNVESWTDIVDISVGSYHTIGLKKDGTVVATGRDDEYQCDVQEWTDIVAISTGCLHTIGLKKDGTVVSEGDGRNNQTGKYALTDIVAIAASKFYTVGLKKDGTVHANGWDDKKREIRQNWKFFNNFDNLEQEIIEMRKQQKLKSERRNQNFCQHCGGTFKGLFTKKCSSCGKEKDY